MGHIDIDRNSTADEAWDAVQQEKRGQNSGNAEQSSQPTDLVENLAAETVGQSGQPARVTCADCYEMGVIRTRNSSGLVDLCPLHAAAPALYAALTELSLRRFPDDSLCWCTVWDSTKHATECVAARAAFTLAAKP